MKARTEVRGKRRDKGTKSRRDGTANVAWRPPPRKASPILPTKRELIA